MGEEHEMRHHGGESHFPAFLIGVAIGLAVGFLYAPRPGTETRGMLAERAKEVKTRADELVGRVKEAAGQVRAKGEETMEEPESLRRQSQP